MITMHYLTGGHWPALMVYAQHLGQWTARWIYVGMHHAAAHVAHCPAGSDPGHGGCVAS